MKILAIYLAAINAAAFVVMAVDKYRAQHQQWRVREFTLMLLALLGGSLGTLLAMCACHHKNAAQKNSPSLSRSFLCCKPFWW